MKEEEKDENKKQRVCVQGLGFVGSAMAIAIASATDRNKNPLFDVYGIELANENGTRIINSINKGDLPYKTEDNKLKSYLKKCVKQGNLKASYETRLYKNADVVVVDIPLDIDLSEDGQNSVIAFNSFKKAIKTLGENIKENCLVLVETTVPPGTCEKIVYPIIKECFDKRKLEYSKILIAHSYERVMPGKNYLDSITNYWRVYSGINKESADKCEAFLTTIINTKKYPLCRLDNTVSSETAKVLENSYRATNIAFMEEWGRFAESLNIDMFKIVEGIRKRPTHSNIRQPGFGVGGYCLTKDPLFAKWAATNFYNTSLDFKFCNMAVKTNREMPLVTLEYAEKILHNLKNKKILVLGISYKQEVADTRHSPTKRFVEEALSKGAIIHCHDSLVSEWNEIKGVKILDEIPMLEAYDLLIFAVQHEEYRKIDFNRKKTKLKIIDANNVLTDKQIIKIKEHNNYLFSIGKGECK